MKFSIFKTAALVLATVSLTSSFPCMTFSRTAECITCKTVSFILKGIIHHGASTASIEKATKHICNMFEIESESVCNGIVKVFADQVTYVFNRTSYDDNAICYFFLGDSCGSQSTQAEWSIKLPADPKPPVEKVAPPPPSAKKLKVLHLSDLHFDFMYKPGAPAVCEEPLCCRHGVAGDTSKGAGFWGDFKCDLPLHTVDSLMSHVQKTEKKIDYIIWTGDLPPHDNWIQTREEHLKYMDELTAKFNQHFPGVPVYGTMGNHETVPVNEFPGPEIKDPKYTIDWLYQSAADNWIASGVHEDQRKNIMKGSYFNVVVKPGLRLISLNPNYCNDKNFWLLLKAKDPADHLAWLIEQLLAAEKAAEKVHLIGHIPPGNQDCIKSWSWSFHKIVNRFESTIRAQFYGHTHQDEFYIHYENALPTGRPTNVAYMGPSATPFTNNNPAYRVYTIDGDRPKSTFAVLDTATHWMNLSEANARGPKVQPEWKLLYNGKEKYNMKDMQPNSWNDLIETFKTNEELFQDFYQYRKRFSPVLSDSVCNESCKRSRICNMVTGRSRDSAICRDLKVNFMEHVGRIKAEKDC